MAFNFNALVVPSKPQKMTIQPSNKYRFDIISVSDFGNNEGYLQGLETARWLWPCKMIGDALEVRWPQISLSERATPEGKEVERIEDWDRRRYMGI